MHLLALLVFDLITGFAAFMLSFYIAWLVNQERMPFATWLPFEAYMKVAVIWTFMNVLIFSLDGLYSRRPWGGFAGEVGGIVAAVSTSMVLAMAITFFFRDFQFSRLVFITAWVTGFVVFWIERGLLRLLRLSLIHI